MQPTRRAVLAGGVSAVAAGVLSRATAAYSATTDPADLGVLDASALLQTGKLSSAELVAACQARIAARNGPVTFDGASDVINAWVRLYPEMADTLSAAADAKLAAARNGGAKAPALCGIPLGLKDLYAVAGLPVTASSNVLNGSSGLFPQNVATGDSTVWARLKAAGMVLLATRTPTSSQRVRPHRRLETLGTQPISPVGRPAAVQRPSPHA